MWSLPEVILKRQTLSLVVTALGRAPMNNLLYRNTPRPGDQLVVTGTLGSMLLGSVVYQRGHQVSESVREIITQASIWQRPPYRLGLAMSSARIAHACTYISDGLQAACRNMLTETSLGVELREAQIPIHPELKGLARLLSLKPLQLSLAGGDLQFLYCIPKNEVQALDAIAKSTDTALTVVGEVTETSGIWAKTLSGNRSLARACQTGKSQPRRQSV